MQLPREILVGPHLYKVRTGRSARTHLAAAGNLGECHTTSCTILLDIEVSPSQLAELLLHELIHAAWDQTALRVQTDDEEEAVVTSLAPILLAMLRANPELVDVLTGRGEA